MNAENRPEQCALSKAVGTNLRNVGIEQATRVLPLRDNTFCLANQLRSGVGGVVARYSVGVEVKVVWCGP